MTVRDRALAPEAQDRGARRARTDRPGAGGPIPATSSDELALWFLGDPATPRHVGTLHLLASRGVSLRYCAAWLESGFALSEDLPLTSQEHLPSEPASAAGAVDDARPDRWGERVIRFLDRPPRLSLLEYLFFAGDGRFGALGASTSSSAYLPCPRDPLPPLGELRALHATVEKILANDPVSEREKRLLQPGSTLGGARPKAQVVIDGAPWIVKFDAGDPTDVPLVEHASMTLAEKASIRVARTRAIPLPTGHAVAIERFDRAPTGRRHVLSAHVALRAAGERYGYPELAQLLRRRGVPAASARKTQMRELFRRMVLNILIDNTDDHEKNHALVVEGDHFTLAPAYDVLPSGQGLGFQQMRVGTHDADATLENAVSMCRHFDLDEASARGEVREVARVVAGWKEHFRACGVRARDIEAYAVHVDRPFLRDQRDDAIGAVKPRSRTRARR